MFYEFTNFWMEVLFLFPALHSDVNAAKPKRLTRHKPEIISSANTKYADEGQFAIFRSVPSVHLFSSRGSVSSAGVENWPDSIGSLRYVVVGLQHS